jgi:hypothetical protein
MASKATVGSSNISGFRCTVGLDDGLPGFVGPNFCVNALACLFGERTTIAPPTVSRAGANSGDAAGSVLQLHRPRQTMQRRHVPYARY